MWGVEGGSGMEKGLLNGGITRVPEAPLALRTSSSAPQGLLETRGKTEMNILQYPFELDSFHGNCLSQ